MILYSRFVSMNEQSSCNRMLCAACIVFFERLTLKCISAVYWLLKQIFYMLMYDICISITLCKEFIFIKFVQCKIVQLEQLTCWWI